MEVAQEGPAVEPGRFLYSTGRPRGLEPVEIDLDQLGIEPELAGAEDRSSAPSSCRNA